MSRSPARRKTPTAYQARVRARQLEALRLRAEGYTLDEIAQQLDYSDKSAAGKAVRAVLGRVEAEGVGEYRDLEAARLDALTRAAAGALATARERGEPGEVCRCVDTLLRVSAQRSRLLGLDAPVRVDAFGVASVVDIQAETKVILAELMGAVVDADEQDDGA